MEIPKGNQKQIQHEIPHSTKIPKEITMVMPKENTKGNFEKKIQREFQVLKETTKKIK